MNFNFGEVLTRAWQIISKHKVLWIFGILAGCSRGGGGGSGGSGGNTGFETQAPDLPPQLERWFRIIAENATQYILIAITVLCLIWIVVLFLGTIGRIGLIRGTAQAEGGAGKLIFGQLFSESTPYFWRMFGLSLVIGLPVLILVAILIAGLLSFIVPLSVSSGIGNDTPRLGFLAVIPFFAACMCLLVPVMLVVGLIVRQAENAIVLEDLGVFPALSRGWEVFRRNLGPIILMAVILAVIGIVAGLIIAIPVFIIIFPTMVAFFLGEARNWTPMVIMSVCICIYIPISMVLNGILTSYIESAWTLTYMRLTNTTVSPPQMIEANA
jgi:hypothetical protein